MECVIMPDIIEIENEKHNVRQWESLLQEQPLYISAPLTLTERVKLDALIESGQVEIQDINDGVIKVTWVYND
jgi:hypothetical protein